MGFSVLDSSGRIKTTADTTLNQTNSNFLVFEEGSSEDGFMTGGQQINLSNFLGGSIIFISSAGIFAQDNANFFWDATNHRLGIRTALPEESLHIGASTNLLFDNSGRIKWKDSGGTLLNCYQYTGGNDFILSNPSTVLADPNIVLRTIGNTERLRIGTVGLLVDSAGITSWPAAGTKCLIFGDGTAPSGMASNTAGLYADDVAGTVNVFAINEAGVVVQLTGLALFQISARGRSLAQTAAVASIATYTVGAVDASFQVSGNLNITVSTTFSIALNVTYTDETNTARTLTLTLSSIAGVLLTAITNVQGVGAYEGVPLQIRCKASTAITILTAGTFTSVTYNVEGLITQVG